MYNTLNLELMYYVQIRFLNISTKLKKLKRIYRPQLDELNMFFFIMIKKVEFMKSSDDLLYLFSFHQHSLIFLGKKNEIKIRVLIHKNNFEREYALELFWKLLPLLCQLYLAYLIYFDTVSF